MVHSGRLSSKIEVQVTSEIDQIMRFSGSSEHLVIKWRHSSGLLTDFCPGQPLLAKELGSLFYQKLWEYFSFWKFTTSKIFKLAERDYRHLKENDF